MIYSHFSFLFFNSILRLTFLHFLSSVLLIFSFPRAAWAAVIEHRPSWVHVSRLILQFFVLYPFFPSFANFSTFFYISFSWHPLFHFSFHISLGHIVGYDPVNNLVHILTDILLAASVWRFMNS